MHEIHLPVKGSSDPSVQSFFPSFNHIFGIQEPSQEVSLLYLHDPALQLNCVSLHFSAKEERTMYISEQSKTWATIVLS